MNRALHAAAALLIAFFAIVGVVASALALRNALEAQRTEIALANQRNEALRRRLALAFHASDRALARFGAERADLALLSDAEKVEARLKSACKAIATEAPCAVGTTPLGKGLAAYRVSVSGNGSPSVLLERIKSEAAPPVALEALSIRSAAQSASIVEAALLVIGAAPPAKPPQPPGSPDAKTAAQTPTP